MSGTNLAVVRTLYTSVQARPETHTPETVVRSTVAGSRFCSLRTRCGKPAVMALCEIEQIYGDSVRKDPLEGLFTYRNE
jgi:hypothetical protein